MKSEKIKNKRQRVPCNGCTLCCQKDAIRLYPGDPIETYKTEPHPYIKGELMLAHKPNGECIYLTDTGCSIHGRAPSLCRAADCRVLALRLDFRTAKVLHQIGSIDFRVWDMGNLLLSKKTTADN